MTEPLSRTEIYKIWKHYHDILLCSYFFIVWPISTVCSLALVKIWQRSNAGITADALHDKLMGELWYLQLFSCTKIVVFYCKFHWNFFLRVQLAITSEYCLKYLGKTTPALFLIQAVKADNNYPMTEYKILSRVHKCSWVHLFQIAEHDWHS